MTEQVPVSGTIAQAPIPVTYPSPLNFLNATRIEVFKFDSRDRQMIELDKCIRRLKKKCEKDNTLKILKERQYYKKPSELRREKMKAAIRLAEKNRKKTELYENSSYYYKGRKERENGPRFGSNTTVRFNNAPTSTSTNN